MRLPIACILSPSKPPVEGTSLGESLQFWKNKDKTNVSCLGVNYQNPAGSLFSQSTIDHLKAAEFLIICDSAHSITEGHNTGHTNHFENLAHLFLQMYSLDCSLKRIAFIVTNASTLTETQQSSPIDTVLDAVGSKVYEVFKTFCEPDVRLGFFSLNHSKCLQIPFRAHWINGHRTIRLIHSSLPSTDMLRNMNCH